MRRLLILIILPLLLMPLSAESFVMDRYSVSVTVDSARVMHFEERMDLDFLYPSHGIIRDIQYYFPGYDGYPDTRAEVSDIRASEAEGVRSDGRFVSIVLGDAERLITGPHSFAISYDFDMGKDHYDDYDEVYINIVSADGWDTYIGEVYYSISLPFPVSAERIWVTHGPYGSVARLPFTLSDDGLVVSGSAFSLRPGEAVTVRIEMDEGYFIDAVDPHAMVRHAFMIGLVLTGFVVIVAIILFVRFGRQNRVIAPVEFGPPDGLSPMDLSYILDGSVGDDEVGAMLFYWADKGYVEIEEDERGRFTFSKIREPEGMERREALLFRSFFTEGIVDAYTLRVSGFPEKLRRYVMPAMADFFSGPRELYDGKGSKARKAVIFLTVALALIHVAVAAVICGPDTLPVAVVIAFMAFMASRALSSRNVPAPALLFMVFFFTILGFSYVSFLSSVVPSAIAIAETVSFLVPLFLLSVMTSRMIRRSEYGTYIYSKTLGFKEYIDKVEKDRIAMLSEEDPRYFYHILSYAMAFGLAERWCAKFSGMTVADVSWYRPYGGIGDLMAYSYFSRRWRSIYRHDVMPPRSSGGHGGRPTFSGSSGHAGGGFSGGGGRSW